MANEPIVAPDPGQATPAPVVGAGQATPFFASGEDVFNTREDLEKAWKDSYSRRDDYTRKSQANAQLRKALENRQKEFDQRVKEHETKAKEYEQYDNFLKGRPDAYAQLQRMLRQPPSPEVAYQRAESLVNDKTGEIEKKLEEFEQWRRQQEVEREKREVFDRLGAELEGFDSNDIEQRLAALAEGNLEALARILYHAGRGEQSPLKVEQDITNKLKQKGGVKTASPKGSPPSNPEFTSIEAGREAALRDAQGG